MKIKMNIFRTVTSEEEEDEDTREIGLNNPIDFLTSIAANTSSNISIYNLIVLTGFSFFLNNILQTIDIFNDKITSYS